MAVKELDRVSGVETTGHDWDGLKELNHPLPKWWLYVFYACIVWALGYQVLYPSWPLVSGYVRGALGYSQRQAALDQVAEGAAARLANAAGLADMPVDKIEQNQSLLEFARANGKAAFGDNCAPCHGSGATGGPGFPSLQDDDWLWGGTPADILQTIRFGVRSTHDDTRQSQMPAFGKDAILKKDEIEAVSDFVLSLSDPAVKRDVVAAGARIYADNCVACHGDTGKGNVELGAPNLADAIWLYGGTKAALVAQIANAKHGVMPTWDGRLDPITLKSLAVYVHSLGGGQ